MTPAILDAVRAASGRTRCSSTATRTRRSREPGPPSRPASPSRTSRQASGAATSRCPRSGTESKSTAVGVLFAPDERSRETLAAEGVEGRVEVVGDVMADATIQFAPIARRRSRLLSELELTPGR